MQVFLPEHPFCQHNRSIFSQTPTILGENTPLLEVQGPHHAVTKIAPFRCFFCTWMRTKGPPWGSLQVPQFVSKFINYFHVGILPPGHARRCVHETDVGVGAV